MMSLKFENNVLDLLLCPTAQDKFKSWRMKLLLMDYYGDYALDQIEDVIQILYKCLDELERVKQLKLTFRIVITN